VIIKEVLFILSRNRKYIILIGIMSIDIDIFI
jgi:hypothetical protein